MENHGPCRERILYLEENEEAQAQRIEILLEIIDERDARIAELEDQGRAKDLQIQGLLTDVRFPDMGVA